MSSSSGVSETASGNKTTTMMPEKSSFSVTCNRLREYLKEKGSFGDVSLGIALAGDNGFGVSSAAGPKSETILRSLSSMNLFPQPVVKACVEDVAKVDDNKSRCAAMKPEKAQMTIFYGGQVMVFNDMHVGKAMEVMRLATIAGSSYLVTGNPVPATAGLGVAAHESLAKISQPVLRDIPIARKQSLARFLEKRKDRIMSRSPYSTNNFIKGVSPNSMPDDKSWLGLAGS
ncbi:unnamed protein product [Rhodiola kirilowii]